MKKTILILFCAVSLVLSACGTETDNSSTDSPVPEYSSSSSENAESPDVSRTNNVRINDLGVPLINRYEQTDTAIIPWDIIVYGNSLFVGSGDLTTNSGPADIWRYDIGTGQWVNSYVAPEEEISRFCIIDGVLTAPGIDAREGWEFANFYRFNGTDWIKKRTVPNSSHCFDLVSHGGKLFAAIEYEADTSSHYVAVSGDNGDTFEIVPLLKNDAKVNKDIWLNDVFVIDGKVCALCNRELYVYDGKNFVYQTSWSDSLQSRGYRKTLIQSEAEYKGAFYYTTGNLYKCTDLFEPEKIVAPNDAVVQDIYVNDGSMYVMCITRNETEYVMTVYIYDSGFLEVLVFTDDAMAVSFAVTDGKYYFGMASKNRNNKDNGRILEIEKPD